MTTYMRIPCRSKQSLKALKMASQGQPMLVTVVRELVLAEAKKSQPDTEKCLPGQPIWRLSLCCCKEVEHRVKMME